MKLINSIKTSTVDTADVYHNTTNTLLHLSRLRASMETQGVAVSVVGRTDFNRRDSDLVSICNGNSHGFDT